jgi:hypothetical protein
MPEMAVRPSGRFKNVSVGIYCAKCVIIDKNCHLAGGKKDDNMGDCSIGQYMLDKTMATMDYGNRLLETRLFAFNFV